jgi:hypothetical protein
MDTRTHPDHDPVLWEYFYEAAIGERDPHTRLHRIAEAQVVVLNRAKELEDDDEGNDAERQALRHATDFLNELKAVSIGDGVAKQIERGDVEPILTTPTKASSRKRPTSDKLIK